ncbi:hypothetical protein RvY_11546 [Ramazzottius varieornatus]|uniref:CAP-Gly domain-containing protein n=1 Tax=Ramazzottius varieornatus TaxID=947166 RepID=A0A1D1VP90_RAMVA|nr:hypothetical protein RvY_11546 [Ramazzottius varieornatus]
MNRKYWNGTLAGEYLCIRPFFTCYASGSQTKLQELEVGELYQNLNLDLKSRNFVQNRVGHLLESRWFAALQSIVTDSEAGPVTLEGGQIVTHEDRFERCLYGPLRTGELREYSFITTKKERFERFLSLWADYVRSLNIGDLVHVWYDDTNVSGRFRCKSLFFDVPFPQGITKPDMWIGIELSGKFIGKGNSDGTFNGVRYFTCAENGALFVSYEAIAWNCVKCTCGNSAKHHQCSIVIEAVKTIDNMVRTLQQDKFFLMPNRKLTVEKLEDDLDQELPYEHTALVICVSVA